jgi:chaperonin GroES
MSQLARQLRPLFNRVLVKKIVPAKKSIGGVILPESAQVADINQGVVFAVGPGQRDLKSGGLIPMTVKQDDRVLLPQYGGQELEMEEDKFQTDTEE